jgi:hypothetical protein
MSAGAQPAEFFVAGGTLKANAPCYVNRPTDDELFELTLAACRRGKISPQARSMVD